MNWYETIQCTSLVLLTLSVMFYISNKRIYLNLKVSEREKKLIVINNQLRGKLNNYENTVESLNFYQEKYAKYKRDYQKLSVKYNQEVEYKEDLQKRITKIITNLENERVEDYENGTTWKELKL